MLGAGITIFIVMLIAGDGYLLFTNYKSNKAYNDAIRSGVCNTSNIEYDGIRHTCGLNYCYAASYNITLLGKTTRINDLQTFNQTIPSKVECWTNLLTNELTIHRIKERVISDLMVLTSVLIGLLTLIGIAVVVTLIRKKYYPLPVEKGYEMAKV